uniref:PHD-type domain-containing protein n=1 Tax=Trichuris muris TaxID=70415 RepID=A0A5S6QP31_TRIMR
MKCPLMLLGSLPWSCSLPWQRNTIVAREAVQQSANNAFPLTPSFDMEVDFRGTKLKGKVTVVDAALLMKGESCDEEPMGISRTEEERFMDEPEPKSNANEACAKNFSPAKSTQSTKRRNYKNKGKNNKRSGPFEDTDEADIARIKEQCLHRFYKQQARKNRSKRRTVKEPTIVVRGDNLGTAEIHNTAAYDKAIAAIRGLDARYFMKPSFLAEPISAPQICALCQEPAGYEDLGILCGPYYIRITSSKHWPPFIDKKLKSSSESVVYEAGLKFHTCCIATAPDLEHVGHFITGIQEYLPKYWKQNCQMCRCVGATVRCNSGQCQRIYHFPCALSSGNYDYKQCSFTCRFCL